MQAFTFTPPDVLIAMQAARIQEEDRQAQEEWNRTLIVIYNDILTRFKDRQKNLFFDNEGVATWTTTCTQSLGHSRLLPTVTRARLLKEALSLELDRSRGDRYHFVCTAVDTQAVGGITVTIVNQRIEVQEGRT